MAALISATRPAGQAKGLWSKGLGMESGAMPVIRLGGDGLQRGDLTMATRFPATRSAAGREKVFRPNGSEAGSGASPVAGFAPAMRMIGLGGGSRSGGSPVVRRVGLPKSEANAAVTQLRVLLGSSLVMFCGEAV